MKLENQVAIVSGGLGDIGRAIALELAAQGADVALSDILEARLAEALLQKIKSLGRRARYDQVDVSKPRQVTRWIHRVEKSLGAATLVVPNAAVNSGFNLRRLTVVEWRRVMAVNLDGAFYMGKFAADRLVKLRQPGRIVFVGSWAAHRPHPSIAAYSVSKAGLRMLCQCMAAEYGRDGILVNEVAPGYVDAGLSGKMFKENPALKTRARKWVPSQKLIAAEEVAREVVHLCDPANRNTTGTALVLDGGLSLFGAIKE